MKVLAVNGSPHREGTTYTALSLVAEQLALEGIETEFVHIGARPVQGCTACGSCLSKTPPRCVFDDVVNECLEKMEVCDGILLGSPVYYSGIAGPMKSFLDRFFFAGPDLKFKAAAAVVALRRSGAVDTFHQLNNYFNLHNAIIVPSQYWNAVHGNNSAEVMRDKEGVQIVQNLGRNMAWLIKTLQQSDIPHPERPKREITNFISNGNDRFY